MPEAIIFDDGLGRLGPLTDLRPAWAVRTGALTTLERLRRTAPLARALAPEAMAAVAGELTDLPVGPPRDDAEVLLLSGRAPLLPEAALRLAARSALHERGSGHLVAARGPWREVAGLIGGGATPAGFARAEAETCLLHRPWDVIRFRDAALDADLRLLAGGPGTHPPAGVTVIGPHPVRIDPGAKVLPTVVLDASGGPIVIEAGATVRPLAVIVGPAFVGAGSTVIDRTLLKAHTAIGPVCKVAGEVGGTIFQGLANKAHDGHLGDSWVGEWANLGAGTTNSNLLNTYGEVTAVATPGGSRERTALQYLGAIIGDHAKFAICTRLMTGCVVGTGAMLAATAPVSGCVAAFSWVTDERKQAYRLDRFTEVMTTVMARRGKAASPAYLARLAAVHGAGA
ncbi:MAG: hypothetical protein IBJ11_10910 [Phycisphaerales bacterium]|nr:hypothetical protein [Phycisphaerales bacterium]